MAKKPPIDPLTGPKLALTGRVVTMDDDFRHARPRHGLHRTQGGIVAVQDAAQAAAGGLRDDARVDVGGTIFPGLIELHNHLAYNALSLWHVPRLFTNRGQWGGTPEYQRLVTGPMKVLGLTEDVMPSLVRYVECKCLVGGVTTSQGIELFSNAGARRYYRGIVRNVEQTDEPDLPEAVTRIADVDAKSPERFLARLKKQTCLLLHLSEGVDQTARKHFRALQLPDGEWAITSALAGIHCAGLLNEDFRIFGGRNASMVWSPMSNLLLYGATSRVKSARANGVRIGLGSDWAVSGSKNLLGELKVARLASDEMDTGFTDRDLVAMATRDAASILGWQNVLGSLRPGARADMIVVDGTSGDPYEALVRAAETDLSLVMINGVPRFGTTTLMTALGADGERVTIGGRQRMLFMNQESADEVVAGISLGQAKRTHDRCPAPAAGARERSREQPERPGTSDGRSHRALGTADLVSGARRARIDRLRAPPPAAGRARRRQRSAPRDRTERPRRPALAARRPDDTRSADGRRRRQLPRSRRSADRAARVRS